MGFRVQGSGFRVQGSGFRVQVPLLGLALNPKPRFLLGSLGASGKFRGFSMGLWCWGGGFIGLRVSSYLPGAGMGGGWVG